MNQAQKAQDMMNYIKSDGASKEDKDKFSGSNIFKKLGFTIVKGFQAWIVYQCMSGAGGIYTINGDFTWYVPYLIYGSFAAQFFDLLFCIAPKMAAELLAKIHGEAFQHSIGTINVMCSTALIGILTVGLGPSGDMVGFLQDLIQYQVMLVNLDSGLMNVFNPMPTWMQHLIYWIESIPRIIWNKICLAFSCIIDKIKCKSDWGEFFKAIFLIIFDWSAPAACFDSPLCPGWGPWCNSELEMVETKMGQELQKLAPLIVQKKKTNCCGM